MTAASSFERLRADAEAEGLALRGGFYPEAADGVPAFPDGGIARTIVLFGFVGTTEWQVFASSAEYADGHPHPLDRWSRRVIDAIASRYGAAGLYPASGPPWLPFQRWAQRAEPVHVSPLGILIHPDFGLWHAYRGALAFRTSLALPEPDRRPDPCSSCAGKPCLSTCPVAAVVLNHYDHCACADHVASNAGADCFSLSCRARRSCPVGTAHRYGAVQSSFHMAAFLAGDRAGSAGSPG
jgi:hypothetical protein